MQIIRKVADSSTTTKPIEDPGYRDSQSLMEICVVQRGDISELLRWAKWSEIPDPDIVKIVDGRWIIAFIESGIPPPFENFSHPLHTLEVQGNRTRELTTGCLGPNHNLVLSPSDCQKSSAEGSKSYHGRFACMAVGPPSVESTSKNSLLVHIFGSLQEIYEGLGDEWRANTYKKVCAKLQTFPAAITHTAQVESVRGFGKSILEKIEEVLDTGRLKKLESLKKDPKVEALLSFSAVWGIGPKIARALVDKGYRFEDLQQRIPRSEVEEIEAIVRMEAERLLPGMQCVTCGSYRRGKSTCGDVDILMGPPEGVDRIHILPQLVENLTDVGFLTDHLALPREHAGAQSRSSSYMGICRLTKPGSLYRRLDLKTYSRDCFAFALLYFTGSDYFNRSMRLYAQKIKSMTLSDKVLAPCTRARTGDGGPLKKISKGPAIVCRSERDIFEALGLEYREPRERNCEIGILQPHDAQLFENLDDTQSNDEQSDGDP